jgi:hypothetical protein
MFRQMTKPVEWPDDADVDTDTEPDTSAAPPEGGRGEPDFVDTPTGKALWQEKLRQQTEATITLPREEWEAALHALREADFALYRANYASAKAADIDRCWGAYGIVQRALAALERRKP